MDLALLGPYCHNFRPIFPITRLIRNSPQMIFLLWCAGCSGSDLRGGCRECAPPPPEMKPSSHSHLKFVYLTNQLHHSLVVHPLLRKILDLPLMFGTYLNVILYMYMQVPTRLLKLNGRVPCL